MGKRVVGDFLVFVLFYFVLFLIFLGRIESWDVAKRGSDIWGERGPFSEFLWEKWSRRIWGKWLLGIFFVFVFVFFHLFGANCILGCGKKGGPAYGGETGPISLHFCLHMGEMESPHMGKRVLGMFLFFVLFVLFFNLFGAN